MDTDAPAGLLLTCCTDATAWQAGRGCDANRVAAVDAVQWRGRALQAPAAARRCKRIGRVGAAVLRCAGLLVRPALCWPACLSCAVLACWPACPSFTENLNSADRHPFAALLFELPDAEIKLQ